MMSPVIFTLVKCLGLTPMLLEAISKIEKLFEVKDGGTIMDLPGYGYANAPKQMRDGWAEMIEGYLLERDELEMVVVLIDGAVGPTKLDVQMLDWLSENGVPYTVVATKMDKVKSSKKRTRKRDLAAGCRLETGDIVWVSAAKDVNIDVLRGLVRSHLS